MLRRIAGWFTVALLTGAVLAAWPQPSRAEPPLLPGLQEIVDRGKLVVAMIDRELPPVFSAPGVEPTGLDADLARWIASRLGVTVEFDRSADTYDKVVDIVAARGADVGISFLSRTSQRARSVLFTRHYVRQDITLLINRLKTVEFREACPDVREVLLAAEFSGVLGVEAGSALLSLLREFNPDAQPQEFEEPKDLMDAAQAGEITMSLQGELQARRYLHENPAAHIRLRLCELRGRPDHIAIAVGPGQHDLLNWLNVLLEEYEIDFDAAELIGYDGNLLN